MKILVVSDTTGYMRGGVPAATRQLINGLVARGHALGYLGDIPVTDEAAVRHFPLSFPLGEGFLDESRRAIETFVPDFIHVMSLSSRGMFTLLPLLEKRAWLLTCHSIPPNERKLAALHGNDRLHYAARNARFLANTLAWMALFRRRVIPHLMVHSAVVAETAVGYGHDKSRTSIISLGCDQRGQSRPTLDLHSPQAPFLVTTGGIAHTKGYHDAIAAVSTVRNAYPEIRYQIIGEVRDASYLNHLSSLIEQHRLKRNVFITPSLPNDEKNKALDAADLYLQPSHEEGFCLAYIEAALRVPRLVGTDTGAIALMSGGDAAAAVVPTKRPAAMAAAITDLLHRPLAPDSLQLRFARLEREFSWNRYLAAHEAVYYRLTSACSPIDAAS